MHICTRVFPNLPLTVGLYSGVDGVELVVLVHEAHVGLLAVVSVVTRIASHEVGFAGLETVGVEQTRDSRRDHAAPVVRIHVEHAGDHGDLRVGCVWEMAR